MALNQRQIESKWGLKPELAKRVWWLWSWCDAYRIPFGITSGKRSREKQKALYDAYLRGQNPYPVAPPGTSDHETGEAVDLEFPLSRTGTVVYLARAAGLKWPLGMRDRVHFTL